MPPVWILYGNAGKLYRIENNGDVCLSDPWVSSYIRKKSHVNVNFAEDREKSNDLWSNTELDILNMVNATASLETQG